MGLLIITRRKKESSNCRFISVGQVSTTFHNGTPVYQKSSYQGSVSADMCLSDRLWRSKTPGMEQAPGGKTLASPCSLGGLCSPIIVMTED